MRLLLLKWKHFFGAHERAFSWYNQTGRTKGNFFVDCDRFGCPAPMTEWICYRHCFIFSLESDKGGKPETGDRVCSGQSGQRTTSSLGRPWSVSLCFERREQQQSQSDLYIFPSSQQLIYIKFTFYLVHLVFLLFGSLWDTHTYRASTGEHTLSIYLQWSLPEDSPSVPLVLRLAIIAWTSSLHACTLLDSRVILS